METKEQRQCRNKTAKSLGRLSIGIFTVSLLGDTQWLTIILIIFGVILALSWIYLIVPLNLNQEQFLRIVTTKQDVDFMGFIEDIGWLILLALFGLKLIQKDVIWLRIIGIIFVFLRKIREM